MGENYLIHHGILGMSWGKLNGPPYPLGASDHSAAEKKEGKSGWTKEARAEKRAAKKAYKIKKKHDKALNTESANYLYKNKKYLNDDEFNKAFTRIKNNQELAQMAGKDKSGVSREVAIRLGEKAVTTALKTAVVAGGVVYLTKTDSGRALVKRGEAAVGNAIKNAVKESAENTANVAKAAGKAVRTSNAKSFAGAVKSGNSLAKGLYKYGKAVDGLIRR